MPRWTLAAALLVAGCAEEPVEGERAALTDGGSFFVTWEPSLDPIQVSETWEVEVSVYDGADRSKLLTDVDAVTVDAEMPDHGHGMPMKPETTGDGGVWTAAPMQFQMPGYWELAVIVSRDGVDETVVFPIECCGDDDGGHDDEGHGHE